MVLLRVTLGLSIQMEFDYDGILCLSGAFQRNYGGEVVDTLVGAYIAFANGAVSPTKADNHVTWDRAVMVAVLVAGVEIDFARMLVHPTGALDIGLIRDEANVAAPRREPQVEVPPLGIDLAAHKRWQLVWALALPGPHTAVGKAPYLSLWPSERLRLEMATLSSTPHLAVDAKIDRRV
ncbi:hypothetical protein H5410_057020 [Solanum commersonii]|uniref:Uncharacterized protein n=1 Tax=Solanum commersonii TaxID=4109 RepID=A0A9J5WPP9_SOLCO|nr:hypothetical protein H5410_057020 [Solanum commersonii]